MTNRIACTRGQRLRPMRRIPSPEHQSSCTSCRRSWRKRPIFTIPMNWTPSARSARRCSQRGPGGELSLRPIEYRDIVILLRATRFHSDDYASVLRQRNIPVFNDNGGGFFEAMEIRDILSLLRLLDNERQDIPLAGVLRSPLVGQPQPEDSLARIRLAYPPAIHPIPFHESALRYAREQ